MLNCLDAGTIHLLFMSQNIFHSFLFFLTSLKRFLTYSVLTAYLQNYYAMISSVYFLTSVTVFVKHKGQTWLINPVLFSMEKYD